MNTRRSRPLLQQPTLQADGTQTQYILPTSSHSCHQCKTRRMLSLFIIHRLLLVVTFYFHPDFIFLFSLLIFHTQPFIQNPSPIHTII